MPTFVEIWGNREKVGESLTFPTEITYNLHSLPLHLFVFFLCALKMFSLAALILYVQYYLLSGT